MAKWNLTSEILRREYNFTRRYEFHYRNTSTFQNDFLGSFYVAKHLEDRHAVSHIGRHPYCIDHNQRGDLIAFGFKKKTIKIVNWRDDKKIHRFKPNHEGGIISIKFINDSNIMSSDTCGELRLTTISPDSVTSAMIYKNINYRGLLNNWCHATPLPGSNDVVVVVTTCGKIFFKDLRCPNNVYGSTTQTDDELWGVAHHPLSPEICVAGEKAGLLLFDTRQLSESSVKVSLRNRPFPIIRTHRCEYSYNGSEILASSITGSVHILNQGELEMSRHKFNDNVYFMGPRSDIILNVRGRCFEIWHKSGKWLGGRHYLSTFNSKNDPHDALVVKPHSYLPFFAAANEEGLTRVWSAEFHPKKWGNVLFRDYGQQPIDIKRP